VASWFNLWRVGSVASCL